MAAISGDSFTVSNDRWMPFLIAEGTPAALIIVPVGEDPASPRCPAEE